MKLRARLFHLLAAGLALSPTAAAQNPHVPFLSGNAQFSVLTSPPSDRAVFTLYGHAALRVADPEQEIDCVFNYGIFDFSAPHFIYRFARGHTDYILGVSRYHDYRYDREACGTGLAEQILNLTPQERQSIWQALCENALPANRTYRYNFFFDNCATRLPALLERYVDGEILYPPAERPLSFRQMINACTRLYPWLTFGCDLALGTPADRLATPREQLFLPEYLQKALAQASVRTPDGAERPLVLAERPILQTALPSHRAPLFHPMTACWAFFALTLLISLRAWFRRKPCPIFDTILFSVTTLAGTLLLFLALFSEHPAVWPNWSLAWLNPLYGVSLAFLFVVHRTVVQLWFALFTLFLALFLLAWNAVPQYLNPAFFPLAAALWLRSLAHALPHR